MGALSPDSSWTPQDDLMLINAVMSGASLELLLRRFNDQELQARWRTLLYSLGEKEKSMQNALVPHVREGMDKIDTSEYDIATIVNSSSSLLMDQNSGGTNDEHVETFDVSSFLLDTPYESDSSDKDDAHEISKAPYQQLPVTDVDAARSKELRDKYVDPDLPEMSGGVIHCTLNTEVLEVPHNNNDFDLLR